MGAISRGHVLTSKNALASLMMEYGDPEFMIARDLRSPNEEVKGPILSHNYTEAMMAMIDRPGLYDSPTEPIHLRKTYRSTDLYGNKNRT